MSERIVRTRVTPGARRESLIELSPDVLAISVKEEAERGAANQRVRELVASYCGVEERSVRMRSGMTSRNKIFAVGR